MTGHTLTTSADSAERQPRIGGRIMSIEDANIERTLWQITEALDDASRDGATVKRIRVTRATHDKIRLHFAKMPSVMLYGGVKDMELWGVRVEVDDSQPSLVFAVDYDTRTKEDRHG